MTHTDGLGRRGRHARLSQRLASLAVLLVVLAGATACTQATTVDLSTTFEAKAREAEKKACFATQKVILGAARIYLLEHQVEPPANWDALVKDIVPGIVKTVPKCAGGGVYSIATSGGKMTVTCSIHGSGPTDTTAPTSP